MKTAEKLSKVIYAEEQEANQFQNRDEQDLGQKLIAAFHDKQNPQQLKDLVDRNAPVNSRLDYGLEVKREADFVAAFFLLLEGNKGKNILFQNAQTLVDKNAKYLVSYLETALEIFNILYSKNANSKEIPINEKFKDHLKLYAVNLRANPEHKNGALIIAAGLRDAKLVNSIIDIGNRDKNISQKDNGATVNFIGYFGDTAAVWSAILLDKETLSVLLKNDAQTSQLGISKSSLLHWVAVAARLDNTDDRKKRAFEITELLLNHGLSPDEENALGKTVMDYTTSNELKQLLTTYMSKKLNHGR